MNRSQYEALYGGRLLERRISQELRAAADRVTVPPALALIRAKIAAGQARSFSRPPVF